MLISIRRRHFRVNYRRANGLNGVLMVRKPSSTQQSSITFYGEDIIAILRLDPNETYVVIAELCEKIGLERAPQERRIRAHALLSSGARKLQVEVGNGVAQALCLRVDLLPLWLVTIDAALVAEESRAKLELYQRESASVLWQSFKPQGFSTEDALLPARLEQGPAEQAYVAALAMATLARHQMLIERQLRIANAHRTEQGADPYMASSSAVDDPQAARLAQT